MAQYYAELQPGGKAENAGFGLARRPGQKGLVGVVGDAVSVNEFLRHIIDAVIGVGGNDAPLVPVSYDFARCVMDITPVALRVAGLQGRRESRQKRPSPWGSERIRQLRWK